MAESIKTKLMEALSSKDTPADTDTMIIAEGNILKKTTIAKMVDFWKSKLGINDINTKLGNVGYAELTFSSATIFTLQGLNYAIYTPNICFMHLAFRVNTALTNNSILTVLPVQVKRLVNIAIFKIEDNTVSTVGIDSDGKTVRTGTVVPTGRYVVDLVFQRA